MGLHRLMLNDETRNPTWSYKDRLAVVTVTNAAASGASTVIVSSIGNRGAAVAAYAAAAGLGCVALTLSSVRCELRILMQAYGAWVVAYDKGPDRWPVLRAAVEAFDWMPISRLVSPPIGSNPFGIEGYKTIAYELWRQLGETPDVVVVPSAHGDGLAGIRRGFSVLVGLGLASRMPRWSRSTRSAPMPAGCGPKRESSQLFPHSRQRRSQWRHVGPLIRGWTPQEPRTGRPSQNQPMT
ncbi:pyridoxal-phosphate dependent enzyme [Mycobacterium intracellulare]|uniref:pyridoxal-phosphate dependent enzyme n=1 Tax=Mycobacterium intracellulare TaxID=1767 RepID=UPI0027E1B8D7|nr:pyridoxal-phosphate dependent enzyme [Mycobacterium intracellulare]